jgi:hypothetical protein
VFAIVGVWLGVRVGVTVAVWVGEAVGGRAVAVKTGGISTGDTAVGSPAGEESAQPTRPTAIKQIPGNFFNLQSYHFDQGPPKNNLSGPFMLWLAAAFPLWDLRQFSGDLFHNLRR